MKLTKKELGVAKDSIEELFEKVGISGGISLTTGDEGLDVVLETEDSGIVIGYHGEILESLQLLTSLLVAKKLGRFVRISLEVGDYKKNRVEYLERLASQTKERVLSENRSHTLSSLKSWERRVVHLLFQDDKEVTSESTGEGKDRVLVVSPRS